MNIRNDLQPVQPLNRDFQVSSSGKASNDSDAFAPLAGSDQAHLSSGAAFASQLSSLPDVRTEKVQAIQSAIANGSYNVSSMDVAQSLIGHMLPRGE